MPYIRRILCIDDDPDALRVLCEYLRLEGYDVVAAPDGASGIQMLAQEDVQLVITDLNMPGLTGMDVIEIVRKNYPQVQIMVVTGYGTIETVLEALHKGAVDYLVKPYLLEILKLSLGKAERQIEIEERLIEAEDKNIAASQGSLIEALHLPCALLLPSGDWHFWNQAFIDLCGEIDFRGPRMLNDRQRARIHRLISEGDPERSIMLACPGGEDRIIELVARKVPGSEEFLLIGEPVQPEGEASDNSDDELALALSEGGLVLWGNPRAAEVLGLDDTEHHLLSSLLQGPLAAQILEVLNSNTPSTLRQDWDGELELAGMSRRVRVVLNPLIDEQDRRIAWILRVCVWRPFPAELGHDRSAQAAESLLQMRFDARGVCSWVSQALLRESGIASSLLLGRSRGELLVESGRDGREIKLDGGNDLRLVPAGEQQLPDGLLLEFQALDTEPVALSIEHQKVQLKRASSLLSHLLSAAGSSDAERLQDRLAEIAGRLVNSGDFGRALLVLAPGEEIIGWGAAGYSQDELVLLGAEPHRLDDLISGDGEGVESGPARLYHEDGSQPLSGEWKSGSYLLIPVASREGITVGWLRLELPTGGQCPSADRLNLIELVLRHVAHSMDELELERQVARSEARYRELYENARYSILITDTETGRILDLNKEAEQLTGYQREELIGRRIWEIRDEAFQADARQNWMKTLKREQMSFDNVPLRRRDGSLVYVEYDCMFSELDGRPVVQSFYRDVTERQALEFTLIQSQKLAGLGQLSAGIAHELRNPLGIMGSSLFYLNTVLNKEEIHVPDQVHKHLGILRTEVERSRKIIENLLSFSRVSSHDRELVDLKELIVQSMDLVKKELLVNNIRLVMELEDVPRVHLNLDELKQAFLNIILNSTQAMPDGGQLRVSARVEKKRVQIIFEDTGHGISKDNLANVLNPFFTTKDPGIGTGLGLSLTHSFIKRAGGELILESEVGVGTTVRVLLPVPRQE
jgi:PAS domain S-box-containing protein